MFDERFGWRQFPRSKPFGWFSNKQSGAHHRNCFSIYANISDTSGRIERLQVMVLVRWRGRHNTWHLTMRLDIFGSFMASGFRGGDCGHRYSGPWEIGVLAFLGSVLVEFGGEHWNPGKLRMKTPGCEGVLIYQQVNWNVTRVLNSALVALIPQSKTSVLKWLETYKHATYHVFIQYLYFFMYTNSILLGGCAEGPCFFGHIGKRLVLRFRLWSA